ncbi:MAG TPA: hypothetical protein PLJ47_10900 [Candidatus Hydrogenedentes bacterium]|nr:hypothetical protein [Candidatus Hydrogenedentota bacterium]
MVTTRKDGSDTLLDHVIRYRFTTTQIVHNLFYPDATVHAARKAVQRLSTGDQPMLEGVRIAPRVHVLQLHGRGKIGVITAWSRYALLHFCCAQERKRIRLTETEFYALMGTDKIPGVDPNNQHYFLVPEASTRLGIAFVDFRPTPKASSGVTRATGKDLAKKVCECWQRLAATPLLCDLHAQGLTVVSALVPTESKAALIQKAVVEECQQYPNIQVGALEVCVVPQMLDFFS